MNDITNKINPIDETDDPGAIEPAEAMRELDFAYQRLKASLMQSKRDVKFERELNMLIHLQTAIETARVHLRSEGYIK